MKRYLSKRQILVLVFSLIAFNLFPQTFIEQTGISLTGVSYSSVAWGDYDNDGDLDILLTGWSSEGYISKIYKNNGDNSFTEQTSIYLTGVYFSSVAWGDYDNDGDLDILITGATGAYPDYNPISKIYKNNSNNSFTEQTGISLTGVYYGSVDWGDYNNDGNLDILLTGYDENNNRVSKIFKNNSPAAAGFTEQTSISLTGVYYGSVDWGDYDNDGDLDILLTGNSSEGIISKIYKNNGPEDSGFTEQTGISLTGVGGSSVAWGDYDNDGDLDILLTGGNSEGIISKIYKNNGNNSFTEQTGISLSGVRYSSVAWGDYDNDGDLDILLTGDTDSEGYISKIYKNNGDNSFTEQTGISLSGVRYSSVAWGDYDNDGDLDILLTGNGYSKIYCNYSSISNIVPTIPTDLNSSISGNTVTLSWNKATDNETSQNSLTYNILIWSQSTGDITLTPMADTSSGYRLIPAMGNAQLDTTFFANMDVLTPGTSYYWSVQAIDNIFAGSAFAAEAVISDVPPTSSFFVESSIGCCDTTTISYSGNASPAATYNWDFDGANYISGTGQGPYEVQWDTSGLKQISLSVVENSLYSDTTIHNVDVYVCFTNIDAGLTGIYYGSTAWGDYDNDGDLDVLITGNDGSNKISKIYRNNGDNSFTEQTGILLTGVYY
ncbi:MAG: VCBS repeat-containing protein, partial [Bacteroidales bacterium]|nr:VCBS repeat-containing protein [Bacteroidales bacterium]